MATEPEWEEWWLSQAELCTKINNLFDQVAENKSDAFKLGVWSAVIEHASEAMRKYIKLPHALDSDDRSAAGDGGWSTYVVPAGAVVAGCVSHEEDMPHDSHTWRRATDSGVTRWCPGVPYEKV